MEPNSKEGREFRRAADKCLEDQPLHGPLSFPQVIAAWIILGVLVTTLAAIA